MDIEDPEAITDEHGVAEFHFDYEHVTVPSVRVTKSGSLIWEFRKERRTPDSMPEHSMAMCVEKVGYAPTVLHDVKSDDLEVELRNGREFVVVCEGIPGNEVATLLVQLHSGGMLFLARASAQDPEIRLPDLVTRKVGRITCNARVDCDVGSFSITKEVDRGSLREVLRLERIRGAARVEWDARSAESLTVALYVRSSRSSKVKIRGLKMVSAAASGASFLPGAQGELLAFAYSPKVGFFRGHGPNYSLQEVGFKLVREPGSLTPSVLGMHRSDGEAAAGYRVVLELAIPVDWTFGSGLPETLQIEARADQHGEVDLGALPRTQVAGV